MAERRDDYLSALARLPVVTPEVVLAGRSLVVVAPHPDDESLGLGGFIAAARGSGQPVSVIFLTDGERSHVGSPTYPPARLAATRRREAAAALAVLGVDPLAVHFLGLGDTCLPALRHDAYRAALARRSRRWTRSSA